MNLKNSKCLGELASNANEQKNTKKPGLKQTLVTPSLYKRGRSFLRLLILPILQELVGESLRDCDIEHNGGIDGTVVDVTGGGVHEHHLPVRPHSVSCNIIVQYRHYVTQFGG